VISVKFRVPAEISDAFDVAFEGEDKSAVIAGLMARAVEERELQKRRASLFRQLTADRSKRSRPNDAKAASVRCKGRP
jgi:hypothetical protein